MPNKTTSSLSNLCLDTIVKQGLFSKKMRMTIAEYPLLIRESVLDHAVKLFKEIKTALHIITHHALEKSKNSAGKLQFTALTDQLKQLDDQAITTDYLEVIATNLTKIKDTYAFNSGVLMQSLKDIINLIFVHFYSSHQQKEINNLLDHLDHRISRHRPFYDGGYETNLQTYPSQLLHGDPDLYEGYLFIQEVISASSVANQEKIVTALQAKYLGTSKQRRCVIS